MLWIYIQYNTFIHNTYFIVLCMNEMKMEQSPHIPLVEKNYINE